MRPARHRLRHASNTYFFRCLSQTFTFPSNLTYLQYTEKQYANLSALHKNTFWRTCLYSLIRISKDQKQLAETKKALRHYPTLHSLSRPKPVQKWLWAQHIIILIQLKIDSKLSKLNLEPLLNAADGFAWTFMTSQAIQKSLARINHPASKLFIYLFVAVNKLFCLFH